MNLVKNVESVKWTIRLGIPNATTGQGILERQLIRKERVRSELGAKPRQTENGHYPVAAWFQFINNVRKSASLKPSQHNQEPVLPRKVAHSRESGQRPKARE